MYVASTAQRRRLETLKHITRNFNRVQNSSKLVQTLHDGSKSGGTCAPSVTGHLHGEEITARITETGAQDPAYLATMQDPNDKKYLRQDQLIYVKSKGGLTPVLLVPDNDLIRKQMIQEAHATNYGGTGCHPRPDEEA